MKKRSISFLLVISLIISLFTVYSFADDGKSSTLSDSSEKYAKNYLYLKSSFGDETDDLGTMPSLYNVGNSYMTIKVESNGNKYGYYNINDTDKNVYFQLEPSQSQTIGTGNLGYMILEMDFNDLGNLLNTNKFFEIHSGTGSFAPSGGRVAVTDIINIGNDGTRNYVYFKGNKSNKIYIDQDKWVHFRCELSILSSSSSKYNFKFYVGEKSFETTFSLGEPGVITFFRIGSTQTANQIFGLDNVAMYSGPKNYSSYRDFSSVKGALIMKVGAENAAIDNSQIELSNPPLLIDGEIYCPIDAIESYADKVCPDEYTVKFDNVKYIHIDKISSAFGIDAKSYDMGLILVGDSDYFLEDDATYEDIATVMKTFVFNIPTADEFKQIVKSNTNNFDHPYMLADQDKFDEFRSIYTKGQKGALTNSEDILLYNYIDSYVKTATNYLSTYAGTTPTGSYYGLKSDKIPVNANYSKYQNNGYDNGGRVSVPTMPLIQFAFAYQMTGHLNYARAAYDFTLALGEWNHWGPAHFLNCADMAFPVAISYDWLYDAYEQLGSSGEKSKFSGNPYKTEEIATILFTHVIIPGYVQSNNINCPWPGSVESRYAPKTSNWNAVCVSGVVMSALVILEDEIPVAGMKFETQEKLSSTQFKQTITPIESIGNSFIHIGLETYSDYAAKLSSMNLGTLAKYGLDQYFPDGSYVESPGYWSYGTNSFFRLIASLLTATGDDFGFMDAWGIDTTCYFAIHSESSDYKTWNFNDGGVGQQDSSFFFFVGDYYGDEELVKVRKKHLATGKSYSIYDILYYDQSITGEPELTTEYYMEGIDAYSVRSSWDKGAIYAGIIGGLNQVSHGHMDAGSFIYHNKGKIWFHDLGADNYNMANGYFSNFKLYRVGAEGHNMISITSEQKTLPYGQSPNANPRIVESVSTPDGGYAVLDMSDSYGSHVKSAYRGMLFTNSRSTVVIQDEYVFNGSKTAYWLGHYNLIKGYVDDVILSADGRCAFMKSGNDIIRVSIVSDNKNLKFEILDAYTYLLDITKKADRSEMDKSNTEYNRDTVRKLAIKCENVETLKLAVVIEEVEGYFTGSSYTWTDINNWTVDSSSNAKYDTKFEADFETTSDITGSVNYVSDGDSYITKILNYNSDSYFGIITNDSSNKISGADLKFNFASSNPISLSTNKLLTFDFDVFSENNFIYNSNLGFTVTNADGISEFLSIVKFDGKKIKVGESSLTVDKKWIHITVVIQSDPDRVTVFADNEFLCTLDGLLNDATKIINTTLQIPYKASLDINSSTLLDNLKFRAFNSSYDSSDINKIIEGRLSLVKWADKIDYKSIYIPIASSDGSSLYSNAEIENAIKNGKNVTLLKDVLGVINVTSAISINTNGYKINYKSQSYYPTINGNVISFAKDTVTVKWHIGDKTITEPYSGATVAKFKGTSSEIGLITYEVITDSDGGVNYKFYTTGWASSPDGNALSESEMTVSKNNAEFWLVKNAPLDCTFVSIDSLGRASAYYDEQILRTMLSSMSGDKTIVLCKNVEIKNTSGLSLSTTGKTLYLNGYTLSHRQRDVHMFNYLGSASADFKFVGPGTLEADTSRTIFTSSSSTTDRTSSYGVVLEHVNIVTNTQLADLRVGQHRFIDCYIVQNNPGNKSFVDLWNKNSNVSGGVPQNLLKITFDGCNIECMKSSGLYFISFTGTSYAEAYVKNSVVITDGILFRAENNTVKLMIEGDSSIVASSLNNYSSLNYTSIVFKNGVKTNLPLSSMYISSGNAITNNYSASLPYLIAKYYAKVEWTDTRGKVLLSECVAVGNTPKITSQVILDYMKSTNYKYTYDVKTVTNTDKITLSPVLKNNTAIFYSMSIEEDLNLYIYIDQSTMDNNIKSVEIDGITLSADSYQKIKKNGVVYYRYLIPSIDPAKASRIINATVVEKNGKTFRLNISAVNYLESLLAVSTVESEKILAVKILRYIKIAYEYFNPCCIDEIREITDIISANKQYDLVFSGVKNENVATGSIKSAIKGARLNLSASAKFRFVLNPEYTGEITIRYNGQLRSCQINNGKFNGKDYIEIILPADAITEGITIDIGSASITYSIYAYATDMNSIDAKLTELIHSICEYSFAARNYLSNK